MRDWGKGSNVDETLEGDVYPPIIRLLQRTLYVWDLSEAGWTYSGSDACNSAIEAAFNKVRDELQLPRA